MKKLIYALLSILGLSFVLKAQTDEQIYICTGPDCPPEYIGGMGKMMEDLSANIYYPPICDCINGRVILQVYITDNGDVDPDSIKVFRGLHPDYDTIAINAVKKLGRFIPAKDFKGKNVGYWFTLPVRWKLQHDSICIKR